MDTSASDTYDMSDLKVRPSDYACTEATISVQQIESAFGFTYPKDIAEHLAATSLSEEQVWQLARRSGVVFPGPPDPMTLFNFREKFPTTLEPSGIKILRDNNFTLAGSQVLPHWYCVMRAGLRKSQTKSLEEQLMTLSDYEALAEPATIAWAAKTYFAVHQRLLLPEGISVRTSYRVRDKSLCMSQRANGNIDFSVESVSQKKSNLYMAAVIAMKT